MLIRILMTSLARAAWFDEALEVARAETEVSGFKVLSTSSTGAMTFLDVEVGEKDLQSLARLSYAQGLFSPEGSMLLPLDTGTDFLFNEALVDGQKYPGKTNERVTQLAINAGLATLGQRDKAVSLLDPMAGRGTTLLQALRYGMSARGIEIDEKSTELFHAHVKKRCKLDRLKHTNQRGRIGKIKGGGGFTRFTFGDQHLTMVHGDSRRPEWTEGRRFDLLVTDLPYGVQHRGEKRRNPLDDIEEAAQVWLQHLKKDAAVVLIFNDYQTKRRRLEDLFSNLGLEPQPFAAPHRMSESIIRDLIVFRSSRPK